MSDAENSARSKLKWSQRIFEYPLYSIFIPVSLLLSIMLKNVSKYLDYSQCLLLIILVISTLLISTVIANFIFRNVQFTGFLIALMAIIFFSFTSIYNWSVSVFGIYSKGLYLFFLGIIIVIFFFIDIVLKKKNWLSFITKGFNVFSIVFLIIGCSTLMTNIIYLNSKRIVFQNQSENQLVSAEGEKKPNIYYLIFDTMLDVDVAQHYFNVNAGSFTDDMKKMDFNIISNAGYESMHMTMSSLACLYNPDEYDNTIKDIMDEYAEIGYETNIDYVQTQVLNYGDNYSLFFKNYTNPQFFNVMKSAGYTISGIGAYSMTPPSPLYDIYFAHDVTNNFDNDIFMIICAATPIDTIWNYFFGCNAILPPQFGDANDPNISRVYGPYRDQVNYFGKDILELAALEGDPKLALCHILMPHYPFIYYADGSTEINTESFSISRYKEQYEFTLDYILQVMHDLIEADPNAIIIIQGDHGITENNLDMSSIALSKEEHRDIGTQVFLAVRIPSGPDSVGIKNNMNALNIPRLIMNKYAGTQFDLVSTNFRYFDNR